MYSSSCSPPRSRSLRLAREREAGVRGDWLRPNCQRRRSRPPRSQSSSSLDSMAIGGMTDKVEVPWSAANDVEHVGSPGRGLGSIEKAYDKKADRDA